MRKPEELVRAFWEDVRTQGNAELVADLFAKAAVQNGEPLDLNAFAKAVLRMREVFPDFKAEIQELEAFSRNRVFSRVVYSGTQKLPWLGLPARGASFSMVGIDLFTIADGKIVELWHATDHLDAVQQLGGEVVAAGN